MNLRSGVIFNIVVGTILLAAGGLNAQNTADVKSGKVMDSQPPAVLKAVKAAPDGSEVRVTADRPLTYTYYKLSNPPKLVIDLAQTDAGAIAPVDVNSGNVKRVEVSKHSFGTGFLSRIEITMVKDEEPVVVPDSSRDSLLVTFAKSATEVKEAAKAEAAAPAKAAEPAAPAAPVVAAVPEAKGAGSEGAGNDKLAVQDAPAEKPAAPSEKAPEPVSPSAIDVVQPAEKVLAAISPLQDGLELQVPGGVDKFTSFVMTKPDRLIIDFPGMKKATAPRVVPVGKLGIANVRVGLNPDKVRVVLDASGPLPSYQLLKTDNGLKVRLEAAPAASPEKVSEKPAPVKVAEKPTPEKSKKSAKSGAPSVEAIDFKVEQGLSRVLVTVDHACSVGKPEKHDGGYLLSIDNCQLPSSLQRPLDTGSFPGPIVSVTPYQVRVKGKPAARILVKTRGFVPFQMKQEDSIVYWDFKNTHASEAPAPLPEVAKQEPKAAPARDLAPTDTQSVVVAGGDKKKYTGRRVTLEFSDADVRKIFQLIAEVSNMNFLIADDVSGTISIKLVNVPWDQALEVILESKNLEMKRDGNIIQIKPMGKFKSIEQGEIEAKKAREKAMDLQTVVFDVNYATVGDVVPQLKNLMTKREDASVTNDTRTNRIIVVDIAPAIEKMKALLKTLDIPEKQVMIEARIVEASTTFTRDLGVQWGLHYADGAASNFLGISKLDTGFGGIVTAPPASGTSGPGAAMGMSFGKLGSNIQLDLRLSAASTNGQIKIISTPKVVTLNNKAAKISQGQSIPYQTTSAEGTKTEFVEAALTLEVTPHITADGSIGMKIKASNNSPGSGTPPPINKKEATTELQVRNGETTVIGGIYVDADTENDTGVPFLQDVPLLGWLFKSNTKTKTKTELLIFITPKIVL